MPGAASATLAMPRQAHSRGGTAPPMPPHARRALLSDLAAHRLRAPVRRFALVAARSRAAPRQARSRGGTAPPPHARRALLSHLAAHRLRAPVRRFALVAG